MKARAPEEKRARDPARKQRLRFSRRALLVGAGQAGLFGLLAWRLRQLQILELVGISPARGRESLEPPAHRAAARRHLRPLRHARSRRAARALRVLVVPAFTKDLGRHPRRACPASSPSRPPTGTACSAPRGGRAAICRCSWSRASPGGNSRCSTCWRLSFPACAPMSARSASTTRPEAMAHVVGYVGMAGKGEVDEDPVMRVPGFRLGKTGVEKGFDRLLQGTRRQHHL